MRYILMTVLALAMLPVAFAGPCADGGIIASSLGLTVSLSMDGVACDVSSADTFKWTIDWGEGEPSVITTDTFELVGQQHTYGSEGDYDISVRVEYLLGDEWVYNPDNFMTSVSLQDNNPGIPPPPDLPPDPTGGDDPPPGSDECTVSQCTPVSQACDCGDTEATAGQYCYAPGDVRDSPGSCDERITNALAANGNIHLCGPIWATPREDILLHDLCDEVSTFSGDPDYTNAFTCSANATGWFWFRNTDAVPSIQRSNAEQYAVVESSLTDTQRSWDAIACVNGEATAAVTKYSPPPSLKEGRCSTLHCYDGSGCVEQGSTKANHVCRVVDGDAWWVSPAVRAANASLGYAPSSDYLLNCGPKTFGINKQDGPDETFAYCQLARLSGVDADRIIVSVALPYEDIDINKTISSMREELLRIHDEDDLECLDDEDGESCDFLEYDPSSHAVVFTNDNSLTAGVGTRIWDWFTDIFGGEDIPELKTQSGSKIYINTATGNERSVEHVVDTECASGQEIVGTGECFTEQAWRQVIHQR